MKIADITVKTFRTYADRWDVGHAQLLPNVELQQTVLSVLTDDGVVGNYFGGGTHGDAEGLSVVDQSLILGRIRDLLLGCDPLRPRDGLEMAVGSEHSRERGERGGQRAVGPGRPGHGSSCLQATGRGT